MQDMVITMRKEKINVRCYRQSTCEDGRMNIFQGWAAYRVIGSEIGWLPSKTPRRQKSNSEILDITVSVD
jgi:hypothetical protein